MPLRIIFKFNSELRMGCAAGTAGESPKLHKIKSSPQKLRYHQNQVAIHESPKKNERQHPSYQLSSEGGEYTEELYFGDQLQCVPTSKMRLSPHCFIGPLLFRDNRTHSVQFFKGTGILISPNLVLTCAHNIYNKATRKQNVDFRFFPGSKGIIDFKGGYEAEQCYYPFENKQVEETVKYDYALLKLKQRIQDSGFIPLKAMVETEKVQSLAIFGYPTKYYQKKDKLSSKVEVSQWGFIKTNGILEINVAKGRIAYSITSMAGQSGCPILSKDKNGYSVIGIHKGGVEKVGDIEVHANVGRLITKDLIQQLKKQTIQLNAEMFKISPQPTYQGEKEQFVWINENGVKREPRTKKQAYELLSSDLLIIEEKFKSSQPDERRDQIRIAILFSLIELATALGLPKHVERHYEKCLKIIDLYQQYLFYEEQITLRNNYSLFLHEMGRNSEALNECRKAWQLQYKYYFKNDPRTKATEANLIYLQEQVKPTIKNGNSNPPIIKLMPVSKQKEQKQRQELTKLEKNQSLPELKQKISVYTLDNILQQNLSKKVKYDLVLNLLQLGIELIKEKKLVYFYPERIQVLGSDLKLSLLKEQQKQHEKSRLLYLAPEVLKGQGELQTAYQWTIGVIIDQLFHRRPYFKKVDDVLQFKNYKFENAEYRDIGTIIEEMIVKNKNFRLSLEGARRKLMQIQH